MVSAVGADNAAKPNASLVQAATLEDGLCLWWDQVFSPSGLVRQLRTQANFLALFVVGAQYGDYASDALSQVKTLMSEKNYLKHLYAGKQWTKVDIEIEKDTVSHPLL
jgi:hypothetical protein